MNAVAIACLRLLQLPALTALVADRIYALILPQGGVLPAVRVQQIDRDGPLHLRGTVGFITARVQVDHYAVRTNAGDPRATAQQMAEAAIAGLAGWTGLIGTPETRAVIRLVDEREEFQAAELDEVRIMQDYVVNWREQ